jgi:23S rRNA (cytidine1920-2'-O)/16S rRNA (cytidine1409-2'-O)-methyltransferase
MRSTICSTGGFTDCLVQRGAARVHAVDVGYGQLAWRLRCDARVAVMERTNIRTLARGALEPQPGIVVADLSFIALRTVLPVLADLVVVGGRMILLIKPQFELPRELVDGGVVQDPELHRRAIQLVEDAARSLALDPMGDTESPLRGPEGNREFFLYLAAR